MRTLTSTLTNAANLAGSYKLLAKATVYPSQVFFDAITSDNPIASPDALGVVDDPLAQDIMYNASAGGLVTWYCDGDLKYAIEGSATETTTVVTSSVKPGAYGTKLYVFDGTYMKRYSVDYSAVASLSTNPFTEDVSFVPSANPLAVHAISATEFLMIVEATGVFQAIYVNGSTEYASDERFVFPKVVEWEGSARTLGDLAKSSGAARLGNKIFVYMSSAYSGTVMGHYYDIDTGTWSDVFISVPTDLQVSLCETRVVNVFERNNKLYMVVQFDRTDFYGTSNPYTLILSSSTGEVFANDSFCLVSNIGYRFLGHVGSDNNLYLGNSNRVCKAASTWVFDGDSLATCPKTELTQSEIIRLQVQGVQSAPLSLRGGNEEYVNHAHIKFGSMVVLQVGYETTAGNEYVQWGKYIMDAPRFSRTDQRSFDVHLLHEGTWRHQRLSMPFYAEITGISTSYDPMNTATGLMYAAPSNAKYRYDFWVDFWQAEAYTNATHSIVGKTPVAGGACTELACAGNHRFGFVLNSELGNILGISENPKLTADNITVRLYGWSKPSSAGNPNDIVECILIHTNEDGEDETVTVTNADKRWKQTYPGQIAGEDPIEINITGLAVDRRIKNIGIVFEQTTATTSTIARIEVINNVELPISIGESGAVWTQNEDGTFNIPGSGRPFVMFAQRPYNALNFAIAAKFTNSVTGGIAGYPVSQGLVGLGKDAANFIVARYDKVSNEVQLVKVKQAVETEIASATPAFTVNDEMEIQFTHRNGHFQVYLLNDITSQFELVIDHRWNGANGYIAEDIISSLKCGIYGAITGPYAEILGYASGASENESKADGIPVGPLEDITDFPASGDVNIDGTIYTYESKITPPTLVQGPYQLRQRGQYPAPYGNGSYGLHMLLLDWTAGVNAYKDKLIALDNGANFVSTGAFWQPFITTGGSKVYLPNRSQHYSANNQIGSFYASVANRTWLCGGLKTISIKEGDPQVHSQRTYMTLQLPGTIKCHWFMGAGGEMRDTTIQDLIRYACDLSGVKSSFPGNFTDASLTVNGETLVYTDDYAEGFDMNFELSTPVDFEIRCDVKIKPDNYEEKDTIAADTGSKVVITHLGSGVYTLEFVSTPSGQVMFKMKYTNGTGYQKFRVLYHDKNVSVFQNGKWVTTITADDLIYDQGTSVTVNAYTAVSTDFLNVVVKELTELREAVYIDLETDGQSAVNSIIQERPVEIYGDSDGGFRFYYDFVRSTVAVQRKPFSHSVTEQVPQEAASDAIVYGSDEVKTLQFPQWASVIGFATKLFRFPDLDIGAIEAAYRSLEKAWQRREMHDITMRPHLAIEEGDKVSFSYDLLGTGKTITDTIIIESVSMSFSNAGQVESRMSITGRKDT